MQSSLEWRQALIRNVTLKTLTWNPQTEPRDTFRYVDVSAISRDTLEIDRADEIVAATAPSRARKIIKNGDTIFATIRPSLKRVAQVPTSYDNEIASTAFCVLRPDTSVIDPDFLYFIASSDAFVGEVASFESGASYPAVRDSDIFDREISLPLIPYQKDIARVLHTVRTAMLHQVDSLAIAEELKRAAMRELFTRGLRGEPQKETEIGLLPESWEPRTVLDLCEIQSGGTPRKSVAEYWIGDIPWASGKDLKVPTLHDTIDHVSQDGVEAGSRIAPADAVFILVRGMGLAKDLPIAVISRAMAFNQDLKALVSRGEFSGTYIRSAIHCAKDRLLSRIVPSAHGTMTLNLDDVETFKIPCPSDPSEADEIVAILNALDRKIGLHRRKRKVLEDLFKSLLHKLMTGEIRVADLDLSVLGKSPMEGVAA